MKRPLSALSAGISVLLGVACASPERLSEGHSAAIRDSISTFLAEFQRLSADAQWDSLATLYATSPDFRFLESGEIRYQTRAAIRKALQGLGSETRIETRYDDLAVVPLAPGVAAVSGTFETRFVNHAGAEFQFEGALSLVLRHEEGGWRIVSGHSSAPVARGG